MKNHLEKYKSNQGVLERTNDNKFYPINDASRDSSNSEHGDVIGAEHQNLQDYLVARDRPKRVTRPINKYGHVDFIVYDLTVSEYIDRIEPRSYA